MFPQPTHSNCPLAVLWLWLAGRADWVLATKSDISGWPWHFGTRSDREPELVYHFKRTRIAKRQPWAPFYFEGRIQTTSREALHRTPGFMWELPAFMVVPWLLVLALVVLPVWMLVSAAYWPIWLLSGAFEAQRRCRW